MTDKTIATNFVAKGNHGPGPSKNQPNFKNTVQTYEDPIALNILNVANLYDDIGPLAPSQVLNIDSYRCLWVILKCLTKAKMRNTAEWPKLFSLEMQNDPNWQMYFKFKYFCQTDAERQLDQFYKQHNEEKEVTLKDVASFTHKIWQLRLAWFLDDRYTAITAAFLVKCYDALKKDKDAKLPKCIYDMAKPVFNSNWKFWCQRLSLPEEFRVVCPYALVGEAAVEDKKSFQKLFDDRDRYFLDESNPSDNVIHDKVLTTTNYLEENDIEGNARMAKKRKRTSESSSSTKLSDSQSVIMPIPVQKHFDTERLVAQVENVKPFATRRNKLAKVVKSDLNNDTQLGPGGTGGEPNDIAEAVDYNPTIDSTPAAYINRLKSEVASLTEKVSNCKVRMAHMKSENDNSQRRVAQLVQLQEEHAKISYLFERLVKLFGNDRARASWLFLNLKNLIIRYAGDQSFDIATEFTSIISEVLFG